jgi:hypothetical protein
MRQRTLTSRTSFEKRGWETRRGQFLARMEPGESWTVPSAPSEPGHGRPVNGRWLVWQRAILCSFFLDRWLNQHEFGAEDALYASPAPHRFTRAGWGRDAASHGTSAGRSRNLVEEHDLLEPGPPPALPRSLSEFDVSWRTPWLYLTFLLLAWLLLL